MNHLKFFLCFILIGSNAYAVNTCEKLFALGSQAADRAEPSTKKITLSTAKKGPLQERTEIRQAFEGIKDKTRAFLEFRTQVQSFKLEIEEIFRTLTSLEKDINLLTKDKNYSSSDASKRLKAATKYKSVTDAIDQKNEAIIKFLSKFEELKKIQLTLQKYLQKEFVEDQEQLRLLFSRTKSNLNLTEKDVKQLATDLLSYINELSTLIELTHEFERFYPKISSLQTKLDKEIYFKLVHLKAISKIGDFDLDGTKGNFARTPEEGEYVFVENGFLKGFSFVRVDKDRRNIAGKKFALVSDIGTSNELILKGISHGNIYSHGHNKYGVVGFFADGRILFQSLQTGSDQSRIGKIFDPLFIAGTVKDLQAYKKIEYASYNRPYLIGDAINDGSYKYSKRNAYFQLTVNGNFFRLTEKDLDEIHRLNDNLESPRWDDHNYPARAFWDKKDTDNIGLGDSFLRFDPDRAELATIENFENSASIQKIRISGAYPDGRFEVGTDSAMQAIRGENMFARVVAPPPTDWFLRTNTPTYGELLSGHTFYTRWDHSETANIKPNTVLERPFQTQFDIENFISFQSLPDTLIAAKGITQVKVLGYRDGQFLVQRTKTVYCKHIYDLLSEAKRIERFYNNLGLQGYLKVPDDYGSFQKIEIVTISIEELTENFEVTKE